jgi:hypothetical protein
MSKSKTNVEAKPDLTGLECIVLPKVVVALMRQSFATAALAESFPDKGVVRANSSAEQAERLDEKRFSVHSSLDEAAWAAWELAWDLLQTTEAKASLDLEGFVRLQYPNYMKDGADQVLLGVSDGVFIHVEPIADVLAGNVDDPEITEEQLKATEKADLEKFAAAQAKAKAAPEESGWEDFSGPMSDGDKLLKRLPKGCRPATARLGDVVLHDNKYCSIVGMTGRHCIVKNEKGEEHVLRWDEVSLEHVRPDSSQVMSVGGGEGG